MKINELKKYEGIIDQDDFVRCLLSSTKSNTMGEIWETCMTCNHCDYSKQCSDICDTIEESDPTKHPTCRDVINVLLGEMTIEEIK